MNQSSAAQYLQVFVLPQKNPDDLGAHLGADLGADLCADLGADLCVDLGADLGAV